MGSFLCYTISMKNTHIEHPEDSVLTGDLSVLDWFVTQSNISAKIDGASNMSTFFRLVVPLSISGIAAFVTFQFLWVYNDFLVANVFLGVYKPENLVVTSHMSQIVVGLFGEAWHLRLSGAVISMIVPLIVFFSLQRFFIRGLIGGAVKG